jgi:hypothetical protein
MSNHHQRNKESNVVSALEVIVRVGSAGDRLR